MEFSLLTKKFKGLFFTATKHGVNLYLHAQTKTLHIRWDFGRRIEVHRRRTHGFNKMLELEREFPPEFTGARGEA